MNLKILEEATKIYSQIKSLDAVIIEIDRFAMLVANGETKASFELKIEDIGKENKGDGHVQFNTGKPMPWFLIQDDLIYNIPNIYQSRKDL